MTAHPLVHLNATLNALATLLLILGLVFVKKGRLQAHARTMMSTFGVSCLFLISYVCYHIIVGGRVEFTHSGPVRYVYLAVLFSHIPLAAMVPFLAMSTIFFGLRGTGAWGAGKFGKADRVKFIARHRQLARWTFPIWLYVSITGVVVYVMLYHLWPPAAG